MQVTKWGDSLAIRLPSSVVKALDLKEGDDVAVRVTGEPALEIARADDRPDALVRIKSFNLELPLGWKFDRDEANSR
jgi:antitoxin MazE